MKVCCRGTGSSAKKGCKKRRCAKGSSNSGDHTSTQELTLAKPLKPSKKFVSQSSRLSSAEKASSTNVKVIGGKTSLTSTGGSGATRVLTEGEPSAMDYHRWLSVEVNGLPETFIGVNGNFISATVEGTLVMAGDSIDLSIVQTSACTSGADILLVGQDV
jgi:hypothetical protein